MRKHYHMQITCVAERVLYNSRNKPVLETVNVSKLSVSQFLQFLYMANVIDLVLYLVLTKSYSLMRWIPFHDG